MAGPLIAAAAARIAPALRSSGGKMMHSANAATRSKGSKRMQMTNAKLEAGIEKVAKISQLSLKVIGTISKSVMKVMSFLAKHSPALKQQLIIMSKAFSVMIRPIGDIMARFVRPMSIWVMKVAQKWYAMVTKRKKGGMDDSADKEKALEDIIESKKAAGLETVNEERELADLKATNASGASADNPLAKLWDNLVPEAFKETLTSIGGSFKELWNVLSELGKLIWDLIGPQIKIVAGVIGLILLGALKAVMFVFEGLTFVLKMVAEGLKTISTVFKALREWIKIGIKWLGSKLPEAWESIKTTLSSLGTWIKDVFTEAWESIKTTLSSLGTWIKDVFIGAWDTLKTTFSTLVDKVMGWVDKIKGAWNKAKNFGSGVIENVKSIFEPKAVGGMINETGPYMLHAGERVLTAGDNSRSNSSESTVFNTTINVNASIDFDTDIQALARKLAEFNEIELRRRVSYF